MRRTVVLLTSMTLAVVLACGAALAQTPSGTLDANNLPGSTDVGSFGTWILEDHTEFAQTFTAVNSGNLTAARARVVNHREPSSDIEMKVASVTRNEFDELVPDTVLATTTILAEQVPQADNVDGQDPATAPLLTGTFDRPAQVVAGERYALIIDRTASGSSGQDLWLVEDSEGPHYRGGEGFISDGAGGWMSVDPDDFVFGIYLNGEPPIDSEPPTIALDVPADGATYERGQVVKASYSCQDETGGSGLKSCVGTVPTGSRIDTSTAGTKTFKVDAEDIAGNTSSVTHTYNVADTTAPTVKRTFPTGRATEVIRGTMVRATFSEPMEEASVEAKGVFTLKKRGSQGSISATVDYDPNTKRATLNPSKHLRSGVTYIARITPAAKDLAGNALDQDPTSDGDQLKRWRFTVR